MDSLTIYPVATVVGGRSEPVDDNWGEVEAVIRVDRDRFTSDSLKGLEEFSHLEIVYSFHLADPNSLESGVRRPRGNSNWPEVGIFAQRGKDRPNHIGVTRCRLLGVSGLDLKVVGLDAINGTPVIDIKPHMSEFDARGVIQQPAWSFELMSSYWTDRTDREEGRRQSF